MVNPFMERSQGKLLLTGPRGVHSRPQATAWGGGGQGRVQAQSRQSAVCSLLGFVGRVLWSSWA